MEGGRTEREPIFLIFMERVIGLILLIIGAVLLHGAYSHQTSLGEPLSFFFMAVGISLIVLGSIMLISKTK